MRKWTPKRAPGSELNPEIHPIAFVLPESSNIYTYAREDCFLGYGLKEKGPIAIPGKCGSFFPERIIFPR